MLAEGRGEGVDEKAWAASGDPEEMLNNLRHGASGRKLRLFAVACCRLMLTKVHVQPWYAHGIWVAERFADGQASVEDLQRVGHYPCPDWCRESAPEFDPNAVARIGQSYRVTRLAINACWNAMEMEAGVVLADCASTNAAWAATQPGPVMPEDGGVSAARLAAEQATQCGLIRDIFANPFRPPLSIPVSVLLCHGGLLQRLAEAAYEHRLLPEGHLDPERLAVLADAMEEAGADAEMVEHLRGPGPHVRGCHVVDWLTGRE
jgi:hypothetical protein